MQCDSSVCLHSHISYAYCPGNALVLSPASDALRIYLNVTTEIISYNSCMLLVRALIQLVAFIALDC